ncbi:tetratricopeptide repeat-containing sensor histidine kinase [Taibaiella soli]|uniref:tetratricopeptide repeat-containing sensor histidine kinase n=1 Tax=Taibaiella soli TaxID=1649169 RepID=UPI001402363D|nr:histidine kinase [Taibaiella soli]
MKAIFNYRRDHFTDLLLDSFLLASENDNYHKQASLLYRLGNYHLNNGNFIPAAFSLEEAIKREKMSSPVAKEKIACYYINLVIAYISTHQFDMAIEKSVQALEYVDKELHQPVSDSLKMFLYLNMSTIFREINQDAKAEYYVRMAEKSSSRFNQPMFRLNILNNEGLLADKRGDWEQAKWNYKQVFRIADSLGNKKFRSVALGNIAVTEFHAGKLENSKAIFLTLITDEANVPPQKTNEAYEMLGKIFFTQDSIANSVRYFDSSLKRAQIRHLTFDVIQAHRYLMKLYEKKNDWKTALYHSKESSRLSDSINKTDASDKINQLEIQYRTAENEKKIRDRQDQIERQTAAIRRKNAMLVSGAVFLVLIISLFAVLIKVSKDKQKRRLQDIEFERKLSSHRIEQLNQEKQMLQLKATIEGEQQERNRLAKELHDGIGGMLSAITMNLGAVIKNPSIENFSRIELMLRDVAQEVRNTAHNLTPNILQQKSFAEVLLEYRNRINGGNSFPLSVEIYGDLEWINNDVKLILYRLIQEIIQNSQKHSKASQMFLQVLEHPDSLQLTFEDNGVGFDTGRITKGIGLLNMESRVATLKGEMSIQSNFDKGTTIFLEFAKAKLMDLG